ncbi:hypothetical protein [uncultured Nocardioides sp.]|uniref:hypothetical protein n=1 Tax=uncultured Nocardioides sp. TaxID=198441 RepID=UPI002612940F|nr:hypothetical protein [uncultured Nocardioides sp.]
MTTTRRPALLLAACTLLVACGAPDRSPSTEETAVDPSPSSSPSSPSPSSGPSGGAARPDVVQAVDDLAATIGVDAGDVEVVSVEEVTWRDGSRGCAQPGMAYTQALVDGSRITLRAGGRTYEYHAGGSQPPARCDKPTE